MIRKMRLTAALACAAALATAAGTAVLASEDASAGTATAAAPAASSVVPRCLKQHLSAGLHGSQAGLGNRGLLLTLTNSGNSSCSLDGYPGLGLENGTHHVLPSHTHWGGTYFDQDPGLARNRAIARRDRQRRRRLLFRYRRLIRLGGDLSRGDPAQRSQAPERADSRRAGAHRPRQTVRHRDGQAHPG